MSRLLFLTLMAFFVLASTGLSAADFTQFRGESGKAVVAESNVPSTWSDDSNLKGCYSLSHPCLAHAHSKSSGSRVDWHSPP